MLLKQLSYEQKDPTPIHIDNLPALRMINETSSPTERTRHIDAQFFQLQDWRIDGDIIMLHIPGIFNISDAETKPLGFVLHSWHCRRMMGHYDGWINKILFTQVLDWGCVILFWIFYMMTVFQIYDDGIFTKVEILQDWFLDSLRANNHSFFKLISFQH